MAKVSNYAELYHLMFMLPLCKSRLEVCRSNHFYIKKNEGLPLYLTDGVAGVLVALAETAKLYSDHPSGCTFLKQGCAQAANVGNNTSNPERRPL
jgi:hypothetical protein